MPAIHPGEMLPTPPGPPPPIGTILDVLLQVQLGMHCRAHGLNQADWEVVVEKAA